MVAEGTSVLTAEERVLARQVGKVMANLLHTLLEAAAAYVCMAPADGELRADQHAEAEEWLERLTAWQRHAEPLELEALGDELLPPAAVALLDALTESFRVAVSEGEERRGRALTVDEIADRVASLDAEGTWR